MVEAGLVTTKELAGAKILAGKVRVNGETVTKAGFGLKGDEEITVDVPSHPYVSRGGLKLAKGLDSFPVQMQGKVVLDAGASTGGFTDVSLQRGAARVHAVDVGYGQLAWKLRNDERVVVHERTNIRKLDRETLGELCDVGVVDVSFISLTKVLGAMSSLLVKKANIIALIKPQFEVPREMISKGGVVRKDEFRLHAIHKVQNWAVSQGFEVGGHVESPITGPAGNVEYVCWLTTPNTDQFPS